MAIRPDRVRVGPAPRNISATADLSLSEIRTAAYTLPGCTGISTDADHIVPLSEGGSDTLDNLAGCLCAMPS